MRTSPRRTTALLAVLVLIAAVVGAALSGGTASASSLTVQATAPALLTRDACTSAPLTVVPSATAAGRTTEVTVQGLTAEDLAGPCAGLPIRVAVATGTGTVLADVTGTVGTTDPALAVDFPTTGATAAAVLVGGFALPTTWRVPGPVGPPVGCAVLFDDRDEVDPSRTCELTFHPDGDARDDYFSVKIDVTTTSVQPVRWRATIDFADVTKFGFVADFVGEYQGNLVVAPLPADFCTAEHRTVSLTGTSWRQTVSSTNPRLLDLVGDNSQSVGNAIYACG